MRLHISQVFYSSSQKGAFSSLCRIFQKIVQKKKFGLFLNRLCTLVLDPFLTRPIERAFSVVHSMGKWKTDAQNQIARPIEKQLGKLFFVVYRLNGTCSQLSFSMYFYQKFLQWGFCSFRQLTEYCLNVPC